MTWLQRFWSKVQISDRVDGCWIWDGKPDQDGYGLLRVDYRNIRAHRLMWSLFNGAEPPVDKPYILHSCDVPLCVNPKHLRPGTAAENNRDKAERKRGFKDKEKCPRGHPRTPDVFYPYPGKPNIPVCHLCKLERAQEDRDRKKALQHV